MTEKLSIVVAISGEGTNLQAIIDAIENNHLPIHIQCVISNCSNAYGLIRAKNALIDTKVVSSNDFRNREEYEDIFYETVASYSPQMVILAGYMRILGSKMLDQFKDRIINIHPSLLPRYPGLKTHQQVINNQDSTHGCSIHFVTEDLDAGPLIAQGIIQVSAGDTTDSLKSKVAQVEHFLYPTVLNWFAHNRLQLLETQIFFDSTPLPPTGLTFLYDVT